MEQVEMVLRQLLEIDRRFKQNLPMSPKKEKIKEYLLGQHNDIQKLLKNGSSWFEDQSICIKLYKYK